MNGLPIWPELLCSLMLSDLLLVIQASKGERTERCTLPVHSIINGCIECISHRLLFPLFLLARQRLYYPFRPSLRS